MEAKKHKGIGIAYPHIAQILSNYSHGNLISIEIGCGGKPYKPFIKGIYYGTDIRGDLYEGEAPDILCPGEALPFRDSSVDLVFTVSCLHLVSDCQKVFKEAYRVLKPGGKFLVFDYNWHVGRRVQKKVPQHINKFTLLSLWYLYVKTGFRPKWIFYLSRSGTRLGRLLSQFRAGNLIRHLVAMWLIFCGEKGKEHVWGLLKQEAKDSDVNKLVHFKMRQPNGSEKVHL